MPVLTRGGVSLRYDPVGSGPPVVLVHAWTANRAFWGHQVEALRERWTTVAVDLRGDGESSRPSTGYTLAAMADDLEELVHVLDAPRVAVVGCSMGGILAVELARRLGERVSALGLVATTAGSVEPQPGRAADFRTAMAADFRGFTRELAASFFRTGKDFALYPWVAGQLERTPQQVATACFDAFLAADLRPHLPSLHVPTVVLHGRHDALIPFADAEKLAKRIPGARLVALEQSGHAPLLEEPDAVTTALAALLHAT